MMKVYVNDLSRTIHIAFISYLKHLVCLLQIGTLMRYGVIITGIYRYRSETLLK